MEIKLKDYDSLIEGRELCVDINPITYASQFSNDETIEGDYPIV